MYPVKHQRLIIFRFLQSKTSGVIIFALGLHINFDLINLIKSKFVRFCIMYSVDFFSLDNAHYTEVIETWNLILIAVSLSFLLENLTIIWTKSTNRYLWYLLMLVFTKPWRNWCSQESTRRPCSTVVKHTRGPLTCTVWYSSRACCCTCKHRVTVVATGVNDVQRRVCATSMTAITYNNVLFQHLFLNRIRFERRRSGPYVSPYRSIWRSRCPMSNVRCP